MSLFVSTLNLRAGVNRRALLMSVPGLLPMIWLMMSVKTVRVCVLLLWELVTNILAVAELVQRLLSLIFRINFGTFCNKVILNSQSFMLMHAHSV